MPRRLARLLSSRKSAVVAALAAPLVGTLGGPRAQGEAELLVTSLAKALAAGDLTLANRIVADAGTRWTEDGVGASHVAQALGSLLAPPAPPVDPGESRPRPATGPLEESEARKEKISALLTVSHAVISSLELDNILNTIAQQVRQVVQVDECTVFLLDEKDQTLRPVASDVQQYRDEVMAVRLKLGEGITGAVALRGRPEIVNHAEHDPRAVQVPGTPEEESCLMCMPLFAREQVVGVVTLVRNGSRRFVAEDLEIAMLFAAQCSAAIANARAYEQTRQALEELRRAQSQLVQSAKLNALGEMAGGVAHDFNNILAAILGRTQLLLRRVEDPVVRRQLEVIEQAAMDGAHAVRRVQEFTRVRQDERFSPVDLDVLLESVVEFTRPAWDSNAKQRGASIRVTLDPQTNAPVAGNASELREVFTNLVLNAVDAMPWGGEIRITSRDTEEGVEVKVRDTGLGMSPEVRQRVFDPFFTTKSSSGTGLGLSVAYGIVNRHHGTISVESEAGLGTEFTVRLPRGTVETPLQPPAAKPSGPASMKVLVVDDESSVLDVLADLLRARGQEVVAVLGGAQGVQAFQRLRPQVVFTDLGMPDVNGWDLALEVKARDPRTAVVLVTGWGSQLEAESARERGVDLILPKPFTLDEVDQVLTRLSDLVVDRRSAA